MNDANRLARDSAMRWIVGGHAIAKQAASASQIGRFETEWLTRDENFAALAALYGHWIDCRAARSPPAPSGYGFMHWRTISRTSCGRWPYTPALGLFLGFGPMTLRSGIG